MKVIMDLVVNHTSDEHEWFQKSRRRIAPYTDYYIWRKEKPDGNLPNNWDSVFEGKAWQWDELRQEYYLHLFAVKQPDLNMDNPLVRQEVKEILRFWLELGWTASERTSSPLSPRRMDCRTTGSCLRHGVSATITTAPMSTSIWRSSSGTCWITTTA